MPLGSAERRVVLALLVPPVLMVPRGSVAHQEDPVRRVSLELQGLEEAGARPGPREFKEGPVLRGEPVQEANKGGQAQMVSLVAREAAVRRERREREVRREEQEQRGRPEQSESLANKVRLAVLASQALLVSVVWLAGQGVLD